MATFFFFFFAPIASKQCYKTGCRCGHGAAVKASVMQDGNGEVMNGNLQAQK